MYGFEGCNKAGAAEKPSAAPGRSLIVAELSNLKNDVSVPLALVFRPRTDR
jgi:hypothetical protein